MKLLDLYCGAGGTAVGYHRAGFTDIVGVDHVPQPRFPYEFVQMDALEYLEKHGQDFDVAHASPPCQKFARGTPDRTIHPDLIGKTRDLLDLVGLPYIIENVPGAPIRADVVICGCMVGLPLIRRVRWFETKPPLYALMPTCRHNGPVITVTGTGVPSGTIQSWGRLISFDEMKAAMGIDWMSRKELSQAIPPAYTEWLGQQLLAVLGG